MKIIILAFLVIANLFVAVDARAADGMPAIRMHEIPESESLSNSTHLHDKESQNYANRNHFEIKKPNLNALIIMNRFLDPFAMEAQGEQHISLRDALVTTVDKNLDIGIASSQEKTKKWNYVTAFGKFLPNFNMSYNLYQLNGNFPLAFGGSSSLHFNGPFNVLNVGAKYYAYRGGAILFGELQARNNYRALIHQKHATISDALMETARRYYNLVLAEAILQIRIKAVETSQTQLTLNSDLEEGGLATHLDFLQAKTQLLTDKQNLIDQQIARRNTALDLANYLNIDQAKDVLPQDPILRPICLVREDTLPAKLFASAIEKRAVLKQYEELRLAAKRGIIIAAAPLQPEVHFAENLYGLGGSAIKNPALAGTAFGSTTAVHNSGLDALNILNFGVNWTVQGFGAPDSANVVAAKWQAREAMLRSQKELNDVITQVRQAYLKSASTKRKLEETEAKIESSYEELRLAQLRFEKGLGKNIDVIKAQQDYTSAQVENAQAIADYNVAQIQLLHDSGLITINTITANSPLSLP